MFAHPRLGNVGLHFPGSSPRKIASFPSILLRVGGVAIDPHLFGGVRLQNTLAGVDGCKVSEKIFFVAACMWEIIASY